MRVEAAGPGDEQRLMELERAAMVAALGHVFGSAPYPDDDVRRRWRSELESGEVTILLVRDPHPVAYLAHDETTLRHVGVLPERWGSGIADILLDLLPPEVTRLWVMQANVRARAFYARRGWRGDGRRRACEFPPFPTELGYARQEARS